MHGDWKATGNSSFTSHTNIMMNHPLIRPKRKITSSTIRDYSDATPFTGPKILKLSDIQKLKWQLEDERRKAGGPPALPVKKSKRGKRRRKATHPSVASPPQEDQLPG